MKLYKLENGIGIFWVIAAHPTEAEEKLMQVLNSNNYGYNNRRKVTSIIVVAEAIDSQFLTGKFLVL